MAPWKVQVMNAIKSDKIPIEKINVGESSFIIYFRPYKTECCLGIHER
jgi:hypothetical protein